MPTSKLRRKLKNTQKRSHSSRQMSKQSKRQWRMVYQNKSCTKMSRTGCTQLR